MIPCSEEEYFYKIDNMVLSSSQFLRSIFKLRWKQEENKEWVDDNSHIIEFIEGAGATAFKKVQPFQKKTVRESCSVNDWDISLLSVLISNFGDESKYVKENDAVRQFKKLRNELAHHSSKKFTEIEYLEKLETFKDILQGLGRDEEDIAKLIDRAGVTSSLKAFERVKVLFKEAEKFMSANEFDKANERYTEAIKTPSLLPINLGEAYEKRANFYLETLKSNVVDDGYCDQALLDIKQAHELNSSSWNAYFLAAKWYKRKDSLSEALKNYETALAISPIQQQVKRELNSCKVLAGIQSRYEHLDSNLLPTDLKEELAKLKKQFGDNINEQKLFKHLRYNHGNFVPGQGDFFQGQCYSSGLNVQHDYILAVQYFAKADKLGNPEGSYALGNCYLLGRGVEQDVEKAMQIFMKVAKMDKKTEGSWTELQFNAGVAKAKYSIGFLYANGIGYEKDMVQAAHWYKKSMEIGEGMAANNLGDLYLKGIGVRQDDNMAEACWKQALNLKAHKAAENLLSYYLDQMEPEKASSMLEIGREMKNNMLCSMLDEDFNKMIISIKDTRKGFESAVVEFEKRHNLDHKGLTFKQRMIRSQNFVDSNVPKFVEISVNTNADYMGQYMRSENYGGKVQKLTREKRTDLCAKAVTGSQTALRIVKTLEMLDKLQNLLDTTPKYSDGDKDAVVKLLYTCLTMEYHLFHIGSTKNMKKLKSVVAELFLKSSKEVGEKDEMARFCYLMVNLWEPLLSLDETFALSVLKGGVRRYPENYHYLYHLARVLDIKKYSNESVVLIKEALKRFRDDPDLLFALANSLERSIIGNNPALIAAYKKFLISAHREHRLVPEAFYRISCIFLSDNKQEKLGENTLNLAEKYFKMGEEAEKDQLSCYLPYGKSPYQILAHEVITRNQEITVHQTKPSCSHNVSEQIQQIPKCKKYLRSPIRKYLICNHRKTLSMFSGNVKLPDICFLPKLKQKAAQKISHLEPITLQEINPTIDNIFDNRALDLLIIDEPNPYLNSIDLVAEDVNGDTTLLNLFNMKKDPDTMKNLQAACRISIINPYMEISAKTNSCAIRNDEPKCVIYFEKVENMCRFCGEGNATRKCSKCKRPYCSRECQRHDWYEFDHKSICSISSFTVNAGSEAMPRTFELGAFLDSSFRLQGLEGFINRN